MSKKYENAITFTEFRGRVWVERTIQVASTAPLTHEGALRKLVYLTEMPRAMVSVSRVASMLDER